MSNVALLSLDPRTSKWTAVFGGRLLAASTNKEYVVGNIRSGRCTKAAAVGVTDVREVGQVESPLAGPIAEPKEERFSINERFDFLTDFVNMVADRTCPSLLITGDGGLGKTFTVMDTLRESGLKNAVDLEGEIGDDDLLTEAQSRKLFTVVKGYSTAKGLYRTPHANRNRIVVFDDCDSILRDPVALNLLKGALDSYDKRVISWNAESFGDDDLPRWFEFRGGIIFVSNMQVHKIDQAVRTRAICVDVSMNTKQKIERMEAIIKSDKFLPDFDFDVKRKALDFLEKMQDQAKELSFRTLIAITKVASRGDNWERRAEYLLTAV